MKTLTRYAWGTITLITFALTSACFGLKDMAEWLREFYKE